jgi:hypothetical protein
LNNVTSIVPAGASGTLYAVVQNSQTSGFVTKLSPDGANIVYSTLLRGHVSMARFRPTPRNLVSFTTQNWIDGIALDAAGNVVVAGANAIQRFSDGKPIATLERRKGRRFRRE